MGDEVKSRRELLEEAWAKTEEKEDENDSGRTLSAGGEGAEAEKEKPDGEEVRSSEQSGGVPKADAAGEEGKQKTDEAVQRELKAAKQIETGKQTPLDPNDRAPNSWKPAIREHWGKIPPEAKAEIRRREQEIEKTLNETGVMRKFATDFAQMVAPYQHIIRAQNSTPLQAVDNLMRTAAGLASGNPQQKAEIVGQIISNYGVDIKALDEFLSKNYNPQTAGYNQQQNSAPPPWAQPIFEWMNRAQQMQQQNEDQQRRQADAEIEEMEQEPFFSDLREDIADLMEFSARRGKILSLKDAYEQAKKLSPEINKIIKQREEAAASNSVSNAAATLARAKRATKTISGSPKGEGAGSNKPKSRREQLSEAWDDQQSA